MDDEILNSMASRGDGNTNFFHQKAIDRRRKNNINRFVRHDGSICKDENELGEMTTEFYEDGEHA